MIHISNLIQKITLCMQSAVKFLIKPNLAVITTPDSMLVVCLAHYVNVLLTYLLALLTILKRTAYVNDKNILTLRYILY